MILMANGSCRKTINKDTKFECNKNKVFVNCTSYLPVGFHSLNALKGN